jgi:hypothetical protein
MIIGLLKEATSSRNFMHSSVASSLGYGPNLAAARQCTQFKLQLLVISHAMSLGRYFFSSAFFSNISPDRNN